MNTFESALEYHFDGCTLIPLCTDGTKRPCVPWGDLRDGKRKQGLEHVCRMFEVHDPPAIGILAGAASGNLRFIDIDDGTTAEAFKERVPPELYAKLVITQTPRDGGGHHLGYRLPTGVDRDAGPKKLAMSAEDLEFTDSGDIRIVRRTLIELRPYVIGLGSPAKTHKTGRPYVQISPHREFQTVTVEEHDTLLGIACSFDERIITPIEDATPIEQNCDPSLIGNVYNEQADWAEVLEPHGWTLAREQGRKRYWTRPGKDVRDGISATTGHKTPAGDDILFVFSSNAYPLEPMENRGGYTKFTAKVALENNGDMSKGSFARTAAELYLEGYEPDADRVAREAFDEVPDLTSCQRAVEDAASEVGGFVHDVQEWAAHIGPTKHPIVSLFATMSAMSVFFGPHVRDTRGTYTNMWSAIIGPTGVGKGLGETLVKALTDAANNGPYVQIEAIVSAQGVMRSLYHFSTQVAVLDEIGEMLSSLSHPSNPQAGMSSKYLLQLFNSADRRVNAPVRANQQENYAVDKPFLSIFGMSNINSFAKGVSRDSVTNGMLPRMVCAQIEDKPEFRNAHFEKTDVPQEIINQIARFLIMCETAEEAGDPIVLSYTPAALAFLNDVGERVGEMPDELQREYSTRTVEKTQKFAMLKVLSENPEARTIELADVQWAFKLVWNCQVLFFDAMKDYIVSNPEQAELNSLLRYIKRRGGGVTVHEVKGASGAEIACRPTMKSRLMTELVQGGLIERDPTSNGKVSFRPSLPHQVDRTLLRLPPRRTQSGRPRPST